MIGSAGIGSGMSEAQPSVDDGEALEPGQEMASPEEQAIYDNFVNTAMAMIYPKGEQAAVNPSIVATLRGDVDAQAMQMFEQAEPPLTSAPVDLLAMAAVQLTLIVENKAEAAGQDVPDEIVMHGGTAILEELVEVAEAAKIHEFSEDDMENATYRAMDLYRISSPRVDQDMLQPPARTLV